MKVTLLVTMVLSVTAFWLLSHLAPHDFGSCHPVVLQVGTHPTTQQCEAYGPADFAVPLAAVALLVFLASDGDVKLGGFGWTLEKKARQLAISLKEEESDIDRRADEFQRTIKSDTE